jgi:hypothetical protein
MGGTVWYWDTPTPGEFLELPKFSLRPDALPLRLDSPPVLRLDDRPPDEFLLGVDDLNGVRFLMILRPTLPPPPPSPDFLDDPTLAGMAL